MSTSTHPAVDTTRTAQPNPVALFISDLHLQSEMPQTAQAFLDFLQSHARHVQQLYLLGDLFEYWAGDDDLVTPFNARMAAAIRHISDAGVQVFWIAGNRDFLVGEQFAQAAGVTLLPDPCVITAANRQIVLAHGDAQCTDDTAYMAFRAQVRDAGWQKDFLSQSLTQRKAIIAGLRQESRNAQDSKSADIMDVNAAAIAALFDASGAALMIHGHTHRPARHDYPEHGCLRYVLPDWDCDTLPQRGGWIALNADGSIVRINFPEDSNDSLAVHTSA